MASRSTTRDFAGTLSPVVGLGLTVAFTLAAALAIGFLAVVAAG